ncbi:MAG TPA: hypothetical protein VK766_05565 [Cytophagaceae bacterium]|jgi:hypothetical protein|nr:hypothetical protein [Cytophagaceae bacterium]
MFKKRIIEFLKTLFWVMSLIVVTAFLLVIIATSDQNGLGLYNSIILFLLTVLDLIVLKELSGISYKKIIDTLLFRKK